MACLCHPQNVVQVNVYGTTLADMLRRGANIPMFLSGFGYDNCIVFDLPRGSGSPASLISTCPSESNVFEDDIVKREPAPELGSECSSPVKSTAGLELLNCTLSTIDSDYNEQDDGCSDDDVSVEEETVLSPWKFYEPPEGGSLLDGEREFANLSLTNSVADCLVDLLDIVCSPAPQVKEQVDGEGDADRTKTAHQFDNMDEAMSPKQTNCNWEHGQNSISDTAAGNQTILRSSAITQKVVETSAAAPAPEVSRRSSPNDSLTRLADGAHHVKPEPLEIPPVDNSIERQRIDDEEESKLFLENDEFFDCFESEKPDGTREPSTNGEQGGQKDDRRVCKGVSEKDKMGLLSTSANSDLGYFDAVSSKKRRRAAECEEKHYFCHFGTGRSCWKKLVWRGGYGLTRFMDHVKTHSSRPTLKCNYCDHVDRYDSKMRYHHKTRHAGLAWKKPSCLENEKDRKELMELWRRCYPDLPLPRNCAARSWSTTDVHFIAE